MTATDTLKVRDYDNAKPVTKAWYDRQRTEVTLKMMLGLRCRYEEPQELLATWPFVCVATRVVDESDPDMTGAQAAHFDGTMELTKKRGGTPLQMLRSAFHDLLKVLCWNGMAPKEDDPDDVLRVFEFLMKHRALYSVPDIAVVGDMHPVGCKFQPHNILYNRGAHLRNPDWADPASIYNTDEGIYGRGCGYSALIMSTLHDRVARNRWLWCAKHFDWERKFGVTREEILREAYIIGNHSFYAARVRDPELGEGYQVFEDATDRKFTPATADFSEEDAYSKPTSVQLTEAQLAAKYRPMLEDALPYFPL